MPTDAVCNEQHRPINEGTQPRAVQTYLRAGHDSSPGRQDCATTTKTILVFIGAVQMLSGESLPVHSAATSALPEVEDSEADYVDKVPALNTMITILDKQEEEDKDFERFKPYLPELGEKAPRSIVPVAKAASHRAARGGRVEQLQLMNVGMAEEERRLKEERRNLLRDLRRRRYLLQEGQRALGVNLSTTNISKAPPRPLPASAGQAYKAPPSALRLSPGSLGGPVNGLLFPGMDSAEPSPEPELCFPRPPPAEPAPAAAKPPRAKPPASQARPAKTAPSVAPRAQEEADRLRRAAEQAERLERLKERRMQKEKAKAVEAVRAGKGATWGPLGQHLGKSL
ncbi:hypothetical protein AK812_SmicGene2988 [Symbiodinium microadriaticum]|uniref:Uncharacterized protein n=1 Tax=Symbiodinium microadriaticum TaxID=2951 RepID=A0A1Q9F011_SYMMI|nr:hypothetical protein AK812_SmicGene2988 [Symbiodinium microadriaticum]